MARQTLMGLGHCRRLRTLNLACCAGIRDDFLAVVAVSCRDLERLDVSDCDVSDNGVIALAQHCHELKHLLLSDCKQVTCASIQHIAEGCCHLEQLVVTRTKVTDAGITAIARRCTKLRHLDVQSCSYVTDAGISEVAAHCPRLQHLGVQGLLHVTDISIIAVAEACPGLIGLDISACIAMSAHGMRVLADRCRELERVDVANSQISSAGLQELASRCARLRHLNARDSTSFDDDVAIALGSNCPDLRHLAVGRMRGLTDAGIIALAKGCPLLEHLCILSCAHVTDAGMSAVAIHCPRLRHLELWDCRDVTDASIFLVGEHCRELEELRVGMRGFRVTDASLRLVARNCARLRSFHMSHGDLGDAALAAVIEQRGGHLEALNVSCASIALDELMGLIGRTCTRLQSLWVAWCSRLSDAHLAALLSSGPAAGGLLHLDISESGYGVTDESLVAIGHMCPLLCTLNVQNCHGVTDEGMRAVAAGCRRLIFLNAIGTSASGEVFDMFAGSGCRVWWFEDYGISDPETPPDSPILYDDWFE
eukprot:jgi/Mesvir1/27036/Mv20735-RA.1